MAEELSDKIEANVTAPKRASGDTGSVEQHSLPDQIAADRYLASKAAVKKGGLGVRFVKLIPPGMD